MREIKAICRPERVEHVLEALHAIPDLPGVTISHVEGVGRVVAEDTFRREFGRCEMAKLEIVVPDTLAAQVMDTIQRTASTGRPGDGKVFATAVDQAVRIRSGERGDGAL